ncbi:MAG: hypothetical protein N2037_03500 [Acidimicrobiales bacterium]|nr:hypothetical protein [Acidimicrobiales bacterium]
MSLTDTASTWRKLATSIDYELDELKRAVAAARRSRWSTDVIEPELENFLSALTTSPGSVGGPARPNSWREDAHYR